MSGAAAAAAAAAAAGTTAVGITTATVSAGAGASAGGTLADVVAARPAAAAAGGAGTSAATHAAGAATAGAETASRTYAFVRKAGADESLPPTINVTAAASATAARLRVYQWALDKLFAAAIARAQAAYAAYAVVTAAGSTWRFALPDGAPPPFEGAPPHVEVTEAASELEAHIAAFNVAVRAVMGGTQFSSAVALLAAYECT